MSSILDFPEGTARRAEAVRRFRFAIELRRHYDLRDGVLKRCEMILPFGTPASPSEEDVAVFLYEGEEYGIDRRGRVALLREPVEVLLRRATFMRLGLGADAAEYWDQGPVEAAIARASVVAAIRMDRRPGTDYVLQLHPHSAGRLRDHLVREINDAREWLRNASPMEKTRLKDLREQTRKLLRAWNMDLRRIEKTLEGRETA